MAVSPLTSVPVLTSTSRLTESDWLLPQMSQMWGTTEPDIKEKVCRSWRGSNLDPYDNLK